VIDAADKVRELYRKLGCPSQQQFKEIMSKNILLNCPVTVDDAKRAMLIYGPDLATIKGKTTRGKPTPHVASLQAVSIPAPILEHHREVTLCIDLFFVQGQAFLHTISCKLQYRSETPVNDRNNGTMLKCINNILLTRSRGRHRH
jgi:hypothetical protein